MNNGGDQRRLSAILAADVVGYTRLMEQDTDGTVSAWKAARSDIIDPTISLHDGRIVKHTGDGFLAEFKTVQDAVKCAIEMQERLNAGPLDFRMGVNLGDVIDDGEDIHGEGVNIAARIEALADPGGICVSAMVHDSVQNRLDNRFDDIGEHEFKHVSAPVRVFRIVIERAKSTQIETDRLPLSDRPSIAVLPFDNMSGDPEQEYFSDGLTEDIITELSRNRWITVIARNTTFTYKGAAVNIVDMAQELGVRYVIEGSVRKSSDRMRINVQLIDGSTGKHVWAERFDRQVIDMFDLQDEITHRIASAIEPEIFAIEGLNASHRSVTDLTVWEDMMRARVFFWRMTEADTHEAIKQLAEIVDNHSDIPLASSMLAYMYLFSVHMGWLPPKPYKDKAELLAREALTLDEQDPWGHIALGYVRMMDRNTSAAVSEMSRAIDLNPNSATAYGYRAFVNAFGALAEAALEDADQAIRLSPRDPQVPLFLGAKVVANFHRRNFEEALRINDQVLEMRPEFVGAWRLQCSMLAHVGRIDEAKEVLTKVLEFQPDTSIAALEQAQPYATSEGLHLFLDGMKLAGLK